MSYSRSGLLFGVVLFDLKTQITVFSLQELAHGLSELLSYEGNVEEDFYSTFQVPLRANSFLLTRYFIYEKYPLLPYTHR